MAQGLWDWFTERVKEGPWSVGVGSPAPTMQRRPREKTLEAQQIKALKKLGFLPADFDDELGAGLPPSILPSLMRQNQDVELGSIPGAPEAFGAPAAPPPIEAEEPDFTGGNPPTPYTVPGVRSPEDEGRYQALARLRVSPSQQFDVLGKIADTKAAQRLQTIQRGGQRLPSREAQLFPEGQVTDPATAMDQQIGEAERIRDALMQDPAAYTSLGQRAINEQQDNLRRLYQQRDLGRREARQDESAERRERRSDEAAERRHRESESRFQRSQAASEARFGRTQADAESRFSRQMSEWDRRFQKNEEAKVAGEERSSTRKRDDDLRSDLDHDIRDLNKEIRESRSNILYTVDPEFQARVQELEREKGELESRKQQLTGHKTPSATPSQKPATSSDPLADAPPAAEHAGKTIRDSQTGKRYKSDGKNWLEVK